MKMSDIVKETATAGATSAGSVASVANHQKINTLYKRLWSFINAQR